MPINRIFTRFSFSILLILIGKFSFAILSTPSISSPLNNSKNVLNKVTISTTLLSGTNYYIYEYDSVSGFNSGYRKKFSASTSNSITLDSLPFNTNFYFRLKILNAGKTDSSAWSALVKLTTFNSVPGLSTNPSYALLGFSWTINTVNKLEIEIDTSQLFNSKRLMKFVAASPSTGSYNFKYTKSNSTYYVRYRSRYGSKRSAWFNSGTAYSYEGFTLQTNYLKDSFLLKKSVILNSNYNGDSKVIYTTWLDTSKKFNSPLLIKYDTSGSQINFNLKFARSYFLKVRMVYPNDSFYNTSGIVEFNTAKYSPKYTFISSAGYVKFNLYPEFTKIIVEMDTTLLFNSNMKINWDTTFSSSIFSQSFIKKYLEIKTYHKMYIRYRMLGPDFELDWYSNNQRFLIPIYSFYAINPPCFAHANFTKFNDQSGVVFETDTSVLFNSPQKLRFSGALSSLDSIKTLKFGLRYFARYKCFNATGDTTLWGISIPLKVLDSVPIRAPALATYYYPSFNLRNDKYAGIILYQWQLDTNSNFKTPKNFYLNGDPYYDGSYFVVNMLYYCRMRLISEVDTSRWSSIRLFNYVISNVLPLPFLIHPLNKSTKIAPGEVTFLWKDNFFGKVSEYEFFLSAPSIPKVMAIVENNTLVLKDLKPATTYTWYVRSVTQSMSLMPINSAVKYTFTTSASASIDLVKNQQLTLFPNPATSKIHVWLNGSAKIYDVVIYSIQGTQLLQIAGINSQEVEMDISELPQGIYYLFCQTDIGKVTSKLIKD